VVSAARATAVPSSTLFLAVTVPFLNEESFLPRLLDSVRRQTRPPDRLLLVDDGSRDASPAIASQFAERHPYARVLRRPTRKGEVDRLAQAAELSAFQWAVARLDDPYDVIAKLDGDLELPPQFFATIMSAFEQEGELGVAGASLSIPSGSGRARPERSAPWHVRGATKFYRRACWEQIAPLPAILGWDTIDESRAQMHGWRVENIPLRGGNPLHLRITGTHDGALRGFRRRGAAAWGYGAHPLNVLASAALRMRDRPRVVGGAAYMGGWLGPAIRRDPRAEPEVVRFVRREQCRRMRDVLLRKGRA
jgi:poly-beta-1,6-N-acetyl-D-glucosamine synthase